MLDHIEPIARTHKARRAEAQSTRQRLLQEGLRQVLEQGWAGTGIDAVLRTCKVPKGSFYHYFDSKEAFGFALLETYQACFMQRLNTWFVERPTDSLEHLRVALEGFLADWTADMAQSAYRRGCLVGVLGQEVAGLHEGFRAQLLVNLNQWEKTLSSALFNCTSSYQKSNNLDDENLKTTGLLQLKSQCDAWSQAFWTAWQGAVLRSVLARNPDALHDVVYGLVAQISIWISTQSTPMPAKTVKAKTASRVNKKPEKPNLINEIQVELNF
jgi:TetR/AcrR family transcriptional regulator, transcriptional repressor for nem operon